MSARLFSRYGNSLTNDSPELEELNKSFSVSKMGNNVLKKGYFYYERHYLNKSKEHIDKFENTFGKIR